MHNTYICVHTYVCTIPECVCTFMYIHTEPDWDCGKPTHIAVERTWINTVHTSARGQIPGSTTALLGCITKIPFSRKSIYMGRSVCMSWESSVAFSLKECTVRSRCLKQEPPGSWVMRCTPVTYAYCIVTIMHCEYEECIGLGWQESCHFFSNCNFQNCRINTFLTESQTTQTCMRDVHTYIHMHLCTY